MPIKVTRALLDAALSGALKSAPMRTDPLFGFQVPLSLTGVDAKLLTPRDTWSDPKAYDTTAQALVAMFEKNFAKYESLVDAEVRNARPGLDPAAAA
jgi:phosphoenolpyruvate carboxykinase (ATP)